MVKFYSASHKKKNFDEKKNPDKVPKQKSVFLSKVSEKLSFLKYVDPFSYVDWFVMPRVRKVTQSKTVELIVNVFFAFLFAFIIYTALGVIFGSGTPLVVVYSASMEPTFFRGDVMALGRVTEGDNLGPIVVLDRNLLGVPFASFGSANYSGVQLSSLVFNSSSGPVEVPYTKNGSVVVYSAYPSGLPIIHRTIALLVAKDGNFVLTKGDNMSTNPTFDEDCGTINPSWGLSQKPCISFYPVPVNSMQGKAFFEIPKVGCIKLWLFDDLLSVIRTGSLPSDFKGIC